MYIYLAILLLSLEIKPYGRYRCNTVQTDQEDSEGNLYHPSNYIY